MVLLATITALAVLWGPETYRTDILAEPGQPAAMPRSAAQSD
jgi:hypothetical protein